MEKCIKVIKIIFFIAIVMSAIIACRPPRLKGTVSIEGTPNIGSTLTANIASLDGSGIITYQWLRDGSIAIGDTNSYTLQLEDKDSVITVTVIRSDNSGSITSTPVTNRGYLGSTGPGGGIIFYHDPNGFTMVDTGEKAYYLEAAPDNQEEYTSWASENYFGSNITGTKTPIGTGRNNTIMILSIDNSAPAARACVEYRGGGKDDWFLPSKDELNELYNQRYCFDIWSGWFWSSSQTSIYTAWV